MGQKTRPPTSSTTAAAPDTDELLSQLAGDEIDRLLADAEVQRPAPVVPAPAVPTAQPVTAKPALSDPATPPQVAASDVEVDPLLAQVYQDPAAAVDQLNAQLDDLFAALTTNDPAAGAVDSAHFAAPAPETADAPAIALPALEMPDLCEVQSLPLPALENVAGVSSAESAGILGADGPAEAALEQPWQGAALPWWLRPLEWINAPFAALSISARQLLGKIALATLLHAVAVLLYVLVLHRQ